MKFISSFFLGIIFFCFRSYSDESSEDSDESAELLEKPESEKKDE